MSPRAKTTWIDRLLNWFVAPLVVGLTVSLVLYNVGASDKVKETVSAMMVELKVFVAAVKAMQDDVRIIKDDRRLLTDKILTISAECKSDSVQVLVYAKEGKNMAKNCNEKVDALSESVDERFAALKRINSAKRAEP